MMYETPESLLYQEAAYSTFSSGEMWARMKASIDYTGKRNMLMNAEQDKRNIGT